MQILCLIAQTRDIKRNVVFCGTVPGLLDDAVTAPTKSKVKRLLLEKLLSEFEWCQKQAMANIHDGSDAEKLMGIRFKEANYKLLLDLREADGRLPNRVVCMVCLLLACCFPHYFSIVTLEMSGVLLLSYLFYKIGGWFIRRFLTKFYDKLMDAIDNIPDCKSSVLPV